MGRRAMGMSALRVCYLALALGGLALVAIAGTPGLPEGQGWVTLSAFALWATAETWVRRNWIALIAVLLGAGLGLAVGLPLYLFLRTRPVA